MDQHTETALSRLLASRTHFAHRAEAVGAQIGREWALERADYPTLIAVAALNPHDAELTFTRLGEALDRLAPGESDRVLVQFGERLDARLGVPVEASAGFIEAASAVRNLVEDAAHDRRATSAG